MGSNTSTVQNTPTSVTAPFASNVTNSAQIQKDPWSGALPWMQDVAGNASSLFRQDPYLAQTYQQGGYSTPYQTGQQYLTGSPNGITDQMQAPLNQLGDVSSGANNINTGNLYQQLFNQAQPLASNTGGALTDTQQQILDQNAQRIGDQQASLYSGAGRYGSFGAGIGTARGIAETNNPLMAQYNQQNIGNSLAAMGVQQGAAGGLSNVQQQNIGNQMNAANSQLGQYSQGIQNMQRQMSLQPGNFQLAMAPAQAQTQDVQNYAQTLASMYPLISNAGVQTTNGNASTTGFQTNTPTGTSTTSTPTPWTTYAGLGLAGIGAASSVFSDRRLKTDIKKVGKDPWTNLNMYQWRYKGQPKTTPKFVGPMAQEVREKYPEVVGETAGGILYIKKAA